MTSLKPLRILMLEDNEDDLELIERTLLMNNLSFVSAHVDKRDEFMRAIRDFEPDVVLSDHGLPQFNSKEALKICMKERSSIPFIIVTGTMSDEFAISCLHDGADDYILKSNLSRLPMAIGRALKERKLKRLKREARHSLRKQNEELLKVNKELDSFVYSVSHNLRGPLASVMGLLRIAKLENKSEQVDELHGLMSKSITKLDETLREILDYSRNARKEIQQTEIDWSKLIRESFNKLEYIDYFKNIKQINSFQTEIPFYSDEERLGMIFTNVLTNAVIYSDKNKEPFISIEIEATEEKAMIKIQDNGIGINEGVLPKVFDMFYRGAAVSQGAGLGLYITREMVRKLNGDVKIFSTEGEGTTVLFTFPNGSAM